MKKLIVFNGVSSSGKTTLASRLIEYVEGSKFFEEIGGTLRKSVAYNVLEPIKNFDIEVMKRELIRDVEIMKCDGIPIVETWHIGNIAYMLSRNPTLFPIYARILTYKLRFFEPFAILVRINSETFRNRIKEKLEVKNIADVENFYKAIFRNTCGLYSFFKINYMVVNNNEDVSKSLAEIIDAVKIAIR